MVRQEGEVRRCDTQRVFRIPFHKFSDIAKSLREALTTSPIANEPETICIQHLDFLPLFAVVTRRRPERSAHQEKFTAACWATVFAVWIELEAFTTFEASVRNKITCYLGG